MICHNCKRKFTTPLELYDGELFCPLCKQKLMVEFRHTAENKELFERSEAMFNSYLQQINFMRANAVADKTRRIEKLLKFYRQSAIKYCKEAADLGHPGAMVRLGFYHWKGYVDSGMGSFGNYKVAYKYFMSVLKDDAAEEADKKLAARYMADMLMYAPAELRNESISGGGRSSYSLAENADIISQYVGVLPAFRDESAHDGIERIKGVLKSCVAKNSTHQPLFGFFVVSKEDAEALSAYYCNTQVGGRFSDTFARCGRLALECAKIDGNNGIEFIGDYSMSDVEVARNLRSEQLTSNALIYFFNYSCSGYNITKRMAENYAAQLQKFDYEMLKDIIGLCKRAGNFSGIPEYVFYADDIEYGRRKRSDSLHDIIANLFNERTEE